MDFKRFIENNKAVSPVIGVVLMVAITVILAAAIGSSVFGGGTSEPAPQANLELSAVDNSHVKVEHLGGDTVKFDSGTITKVMADSEDVSANFSDLTSFEVGDTGTVDLSGVSNLTITSGTTVNFKIVDVATSQLICDQDLRF